MVYRGYIGSRMLGGRSVPQHIQQLVIREFCRRHGLTFLLSATEYCMEGSTMMLEAAMKEKDIQGVIMYSMFLMPASREKRAAVYRAFNGTGKNLIFAAEDVIVRDNRSARELEDTFQLMELYERNQLSGFTSRFDQA